MNLQTKLPTPWRFARCIPHSNIPNELRDFLLDPGSTTRRMQREYAAQTKVDLLKQEWCYPHYQEAKLLNIPLRQNALIREVYLSCQNKIWMYAKTTFPSYLFTGKTTHLLTELDQRPLGKLLFRDPTMRRTEFELVLLKPHHEEYQWAIQRYAAPDSLWARRSIFWLQGKPLLLMEVFFSGFFELVKVKK